MARRFGETKFAEILPPNLAQDDGLKAVADSLDKILAPSVPGIVSLLIYARLAKAKPEELLPPLMRLANLCGGLDSLSEPLLDMLAWQFHVDGYEAADDYEAYSSPPGTAAAAQRSAAGVAPPASELECRAGMRGRKLLAKERMLLQSLMLHRRKGTPWAVRNALMAAFGMDAGIDEWFKYGGKPYFFRAWLDVSGLFWDQDATPKALRLINEYKNVRSWLEYLETRSRTNMEHHTGIGLASFTRARNRLYFPPVPAPDMLTGTGVGVKTQTRAKIYFYMPPEPCPRLRPCKGAGLLAYTKSRLNLWRSPMPAPDFSRRAGFALAARTRSGFVK